MSSGGGRRHGGSGVGVNQSSSRSSQPYIYGPPASASQVQGGAGGRRSPYQDDDRGGRSRKRNRSKSANPNRRDHRHRRPSSPPSNQGAAVSDPSTDHRHSGPRQDRRSWAAGRRQDVAVSDTSSNTDRGRLKQQFRGGSRYPLSGVSPYAPHASSSSGGRTRRDDTDAASAVSFSIATTAPTASSSGYAASGRHRSSSPRPNAGATSSALTVSGGRRTPHQGLASLPPGVNTELVFSLGMVDDERVLAYMNHIGDSAIINAALICVYQMQLRGKVVGGPAPLLMAQLRDYEKHGTPTIPAGVRTELIPPEWLYYLELLDYISKVDYTTTNAALDELNQIKRRMSVIVERGPGLLMTLLRKHEDLAAAATSHPNGNVGDDSRQEVFIRRRKEKVGGGNNGERESFSSPPMNATSASTTDGVVGAAIGGGISACDVSPLGSEDPSGGDPSTVPHSDETARSLVQDLVRAMESGEDNQEERRAKIDQLRTHEPDDVVSACLTLLNSYSSSRNEARVKVLLSVIFSHLHAAKRDKNDKEEAALHIKSFRMSTDFKNNLVQACEQDPDIVSSVQRFADKTKKHGIFTMNFVDRTFKPEFSSILQRRERQENDRREAEIQQVEEERQQRAEAERQHLETERRKRVANERRKMEAQRRKALAEQAVQEKELKEAEARLQQRRDAAESARIKASAKQSKEEEAAAAAKDQPAAKKAKRPAAEAARIEASAKETEEEVVPARLQVVEDQLKKLMAQEDTSVIANDLPVILDSIEDLAKAGLLDRELLMSTRVKPLLKNVGRRLDSSSVICKRAGDIYAKLKEIKKTKRKGNGNDLPARASPSSKRTPPKRQRKESSILAESSGAVPLADNSSAINSPAKGRHNPRSAVSTSGVGAPSEKPQFSKPLPPRKKKKKVEKRAKKKRASSNPTEPVKESYAQCKAMDEQTQDLYSDNGETSEKAGFGPIPPFHPIDDDQDELEPNLEVTEEWRQSVPPAKAKLIDVILYFIIHHEDYSNNIYRGRSIYRRHRMFLVLAQVEEDALRNLVRLIEDGFDSKDAEEKLCIAEKLCKWSYNTKSGEFYDSNGNIIANASRGELAKYSGIYYAFSFDQGDNLIAYTGGKFMGLSRFTDYACINNPKIPRLRDTDGDPPANLVFCCMVQFSFLGIGPTGHPAPDLRNHFVEGVESAYLMALRPSILGSGMYGDVPSMSFKEKSEVGKQRFQRHGFSIFAGAASFWSGTGGSNAGKGGTGKESMGKSGAPKGKARKATKDGASSAFLDPADPSQHAKFRFFTSSAMESTTGSLRWGLDRYGLDKKGSVRHYLSTQAKKDGGGRSTKHIDRTRSIQYLPPDGSKEIEIGSVIEDLHPIPTAWVCILGIDMKFGTNDIRNKLKRELEQSGTASNDITEVGIVGVKRSSAGAVYIKFNMVWEAMGCEAVLDGTTRLFGGSTICVTRVLENDLPSALKLSEARKRDQEKEAKAAKAAPEP